VKHLLYTDKYTIEGARHRVEQYRRSGALRAESRRALELETVRDLRAGLDDLLALIDGRKVAGGQ